MSAANPIDPGPIDPGPIDPGPIDADPFDADMADVVSLRDRITLVNGRTFTVARPDGSVRSGSEGTVFEDLRMLSRVVFDVRASGEAGLLPRQHLTSSTPTPFSAVSVSRREPGSGADHHEPTEFFAHRQWVGRGVRHDFEIHNSGTTELQRVVSLSVASDFAHVFEVKAGERGTLDGVMVADDVASLGIVNPGTSRDLLVAIATAPPPTRIDVAAGRLEWDVRCPPRGWCCVSVTFEPVWHGRRTQLLFPLGDRPKVGPVLANRRRVAEDSELRLDTTDERLARAFDRSLTDLASLRIFDPAAPTDVVVAAGAPWFMTLFGRDSILTAWMALPFVPDLAVGVLTVLAGLQGTATRPESEEEPGKILHELRREGGSDAFAQRGRYYGTVDATPLFVMLAAETHRWGHLDGVTLERLWPSIVSAIEWVRRSIRRAPSHFLAYQRSTAVGLSNQGWKDSWDGISFADGRLPSGPISLAEVQGYCYAALRGAAHLASFVRDPTLDPQVLLAEADALRERFNDVFWNEASSSFVVGIVDEATPIDSVTSNPGHALWCGVADSDLADRYLDRCLDDLWTGWGLRTLSPAAAAFNPLSYHNGSVWPHDTALVIAGAAALGRHDAVDHLIDGSLDAADHFGGRPPELFAGTDRADFPSPIDYPNSCAPQAWASASILMNLRSSLGLAPPPRPGDPPVVDARSGLASDLSSLSGLCAGGERYRLDGTTRKMERMERF